MTIHQCPKCELRFAFKTELEDHCRTDHPDFQHVYPAVHHDDPAPEHPHHHYEPDKSDEPAVERVLHRLADWTVPHQH